MVTITDVAREAGVSKTTVSRVLNQSSHAVHPATRQRVLEAMARLGFHPNALARSLYSKSTRTVGLIIPDISNLYYAGIARGVEDVASNEGYTVLLCDTDRRPEKEQVYLNTLIEKRVEGIILAGGGSTQARTLDDVVQAGISVVVVGKHPLDFPAVRVDNTAGAREATTHLIAQGHQRIAFITGPAHSITSKERCQGYLQALEQANLSNPLILPGDFRPESGYQAGKMLLAIKPRPTAVFACNDMMAIGVIKAVNEAGLSIPQDIALVGFDDIPIASYLRPSLTTVAIPMYQIGKVAMDVLCQALRGQTPPPITWLELKLIVRESSGQSSLP